MVELRVHRDMVSRPHERRIWCCSISWHASCHKLGLQTILRISLFFSVYSPVTLLFPADYIHETVMHSNNLCGLLWCLCSAGADPCACLPPNTQPSPTGHSADRGRAGPHRPANWTHPAPPEGRVRPRTRWLWEEDQRVSWNPEW